MLWKVMKNFQMINSHLHGLSKLPNKSMTKGGKHQKESKPLSPTRTARPGKPLILIHIQCLISTHSITICKIELFIDKL